MVSLHRAKRGLNFIGETQSWLIGTATEEDLSGLRDEMFKPSEDEARVNRVVRATSVLLTDHETLHASIVDIVNNLTDRADLQTSLIICMLDLPDPL